MNPKLFIFLSLIFYLAVRRTADPLWQFCFIYSGALTVCVLLYIKDDGNKKTKKKRGSR